MQLVSQQLSQVMFYTHKTRLNNKRRCTLLFYCTKHRFEPVLQDKLHEQILRYLTSQTRWPSVRLYVAFCHQYLTPVLYTLSHTRLSASGPTGCSLNEANYLGDGFFVWWRSHQHYAIVGWSPWKCGTSCVTDIHRKVRRQRKLNESYGEQRRYQRRWRVRNSIIQLVSSIIVLFIFWLFLNSTFCFLGRASSNFLILRWNRSAVLRRISRLWVPKDKLIAMAARLSRKDAIVLAMPRCMI